MRYLAHASLIALAMSPVPLAAQDSGSPAPVPSARPGDFRLPTPAPTTAPTDVQGPVDPDSPILTRPRAPAPRPTQTAEPAPAPAPAPTPAPGAVRPAPAPLPVPPQRTGSLPPRFTPPTAPTPEESAAVAESQSPFEGIFGDSTPTDAANAPSSQPAADAPTAQSATPPAESGIPAWLYALGGALVLFGAAAAWFATRRRKPGKKDAPPIERPTIERLTVATVSPPATVAEPPLAAHRGPALAIEARAVRLSRSMMFATLAYEIHATNRSGRTLEQVRLGGDLVTAHARVPAQQQLADPAVPLAPMQVIERLEPGESTSLTGELRLPVAEIRPIPHGKAVVYVPLLRVRAEADGVEPLARTFIVGLLPQVSGGRLQPFRLDEMPQTYHAVGQKALD